MPREIERRFLVTKLSPDYRSFFNSPGVDIWQGYLGGLVKNHSLRVRIYNNIKAELTRKIGQGIERDESLPFSIPIEFGNELRDSITKYIEKIRYGRNYTKWELNFFKPPLDGIIIAEIEIEHRNQKFKMPGCIEDSIEITDSITNHLLAKLAVELRHSGEPALPYILKYIISPIPLIVLVGGPGSGKSGIMALLQARGDFHCVPEVASMVMSQLNIKPDKYPNKHFQKLIYDASNLFEFRSAHYATMQGKSALVLDRAMLDGAGYFDGGIEEFERVLGTNIKDEYVRYKIVICLDVPPEDIYNMIKSNNPDRTEDYQQARRRGDRTFEVWKNHPNFVFIGNDGGWDEKVRKVKEAIDKCFKNDRI